MTDYDRSCIRGCGEDYCRNDNCMSPETIEAKERHSAERRAAAREANLNSLIEPMKNNARIYLNSILHELNIPNSVQQLPMDFSGMEERFANMDDGEWTLVYGHLSSVPKGSSAAIQLYDALPGDLLVSKLLSSNPKY